MHFKLISLIKIKLYNYKSKISINLSIILIIVISYFYNSYKNLYPPEKLFDKLKIYSEEETLDEIINNNKSISRIGDGELSLIYGEDIYFQNYNKNLKKREIILYLSGLKINEYIV